MQDSLALVRARTYRYREGHGGVKKACSLSYLERKYAKCSSHPADYVGINGRHILQRNALTLLRLQNLQHRHI